MLESVAATARAEEVWMEADALDNHTSDYVAWRYIATSGGVIRIYPGTQLDTTGKRANRYPW